MNVCDRWSCIEHFKCFTSESNGIVGIRVSFSVWQLLTLFEPLKWCQKMYIQMTSNSLELELLLYQFHMCHPQNVHSNSSSINTYATMNAFMSLSFHCDDHDVWLSQYWYVSSLARVVDVRARSFISICICVCLYFCLCTCTSCACGEWMQVCMRA